MSDWKEYKLGELATFYNGRAYKNGEFKTSGTPIVRIQNLTGEGKTVYSDLQLDENKYIENGDLIYAWSATFGPYIWRGKKSIYHYHIWKIVCNKEIIDKFYFYYKLKLISDSLKDNGNGSIFVHITKSFMENFKIKIPSLEKQKYISNILSNLDKKIIFNTQINQTLEQIAQTLFKSWFVDFDPVRAKVQALSDGLTLEQAELAAMQEISGKTPEELTALSQAQPDRYAELVETAKAFPCEMVEVDGGEVPKGWEVSTISECSLKIQNGGTPKRSNLEFWENGEIPWLSSGEVCNNKVLVQSKEYITDLGLKGSAAKLIPPYSTLVAIYASPTAGKCAFSGFETSTNQAVCAIIPKEEYTFFNYYHLQLQEKYFANQASGSAQQNISKKIIEETPVLIPNKVILKKFNLLAKPIMNKTIENLKENNNLERKRDLLLPKLLNGDIQNE